MCLLTIVYIIRYVFGHYWVCSYVHVLYVCIYAPRSQIQIFNLTNLMKADSVYNQVCFHPFFRTFTCAYVCMHACMHRRIDLMNFLSPQAFLCPCICIFTYTYIYIYTYITGIATTDIFRQRKSSIRARLA